jgi:CheY-like chemotaxis protein
MVHSIISQHKGHVVVDSTLGQGTTFHIYLPRIDADQPRMESKVPADRLNGTESILIVEDESQLRKLAGEALRVHGYKIHEAGSSIEALERLASLGSIDLVLTDVVMPGLSGRALADELSRRCPGVRIVFMSGYTEDAVIRHGVQSETVHFLQKPFTPHVLVRKVREVLDRSPVRTAFPVPSTNCQPSVRAE